MDNIDLKRIKKHYGENFAKLCRELFPTILETPGALSKIIFEKFDTSPTLFEDVINVKEDFKNFVLSFFVEQKKGESNVPSKTAVQLLDEAGYILYPECKTEEDIQNFKKYYAPGEELCTFNGGRLSSCRVWFAVKKDVDKIKRGNFPNPNRQDEYGTSVISIQFTKSKNPTVSIKNRYNHAVNNPDATFGNNLDKIKFGLAAAFCKDYNINLAYQFSHMLNLDGYVLSSDGKFYKSNVKIDDKVYCANNIIVDFGGRTQTYDKSKYILAENYLFDLSQKKITNLERKKADSFIKSIGPIKSINVLYDENKNRVIKIAPYFGGEIKIVTDKANQIIEYSNPHLKSVGDEFLFWNVSLKKLDTPNLKKVGPCFLFSNKSLENLNLPYLENANIMFLINNQKLTKLNLPKLKGVGSDFLRNNTRISEVNLPSLKVVGNGFMYNNQNIEKLSLPNLETVYDSFMLRNKKIKEVDLPKLKEVGKDFLFANEGLTKLSLPSLEFADDQFIAFNKNIQELNLPNLMEVGDSFLDNNRMLTKLHLPKVEYIGNDFMSSNAKIDDIYLPRLEEISGDFLKSNPTVNDFLYKQRTF